ncbi:MAG TPA: phospho-N-acetylmuramoyl-pentapeptide-transferase [Anaerolineae bacterium]|nr:phospho-N-acetylmuramoyl-pentapeptide-transferase [Anaerolineae bacterium]HQI86264.1 phospho-N-acetylmuramoyl-pentapeptide-transferase [Anaerolineae bacterium]
MFPWLGQRLVEIYGPFRLLNSYLFLAGIGTTMAAVLTWFLLPKLWRYLPTDGGRLHAVDAQESKGKPVSGGLVFVSIFVFVALLVLPHEWRFTGVLACMLLSMVEGYLDDRKPGGWGEYRLGLADLGIALLGALIICRCEPVVMWLPLIKTPVTVTPWVFIPLATILLWLSINATNCTDGVDGLSGSLLMLAFTYLGGILYGILGHQEISAYLLVPHYPDGAVWGIMAFVMAGALGGYLWYNANPSMVLMGDAGSRPIGLLLGMLVLASGNPFLILVVAGVVLVNGGTGLVKVALLRFFKIGIFKNVRYPLHDHVRQVEGWSNSQVLVRFMLLQAIGTPLLLVLLFKVR